MKSISLRIEDEIAAKIDNIAKIQDRDRSYIINKAIKDYIAHEEWIIEQIHAGLKDIEEGKVYSEEEVFEFLEKDNSKEI
jgi:predicted transcriptional regulator